MNDADIRVLMSGLLADRWIGGILFDEHGLPIRRRTRVVNLYKDEYDVYIGRPGKGQDGYFGNPVEINKTCPVCGEMHTTKDDTLPCYKVYLTARIAEDETFRTRLGNLRGRVLGCFCKPAACHGDIIVKWLEDEQD